MKRKKKVAVVGAGIYGTTIASYLAEYCEVHLFEKNSEILMGASLVNQYRLHRGYHYPRSQETVSACHAAEKKFRDFYKGCVIDTNDHYYAIAKKDSKTSVAQFESFCNTNHLEFIPETLPLLNYKKIDRSYRVVEGLIHTEKLFSVVKQNLLHPNIHLYLNSEMKKGDFDEFDFTVICTYSQNNEFIDKKSDYQFEVCEKIIVKLPEAFKNLSVVIMDGPFFCLDPYGTTGLHLIGNVKEAIHETNIGQSVHISAKLLPYINNGFLKNVPETKFMQFIESAVPFIDEMKNAEYVASMFTVRTVLPHKDATDERPTIVRKLDEKTITVFAGKIGNCVEAAESVVSHIIPQRL